MKKYLINSTVPLIIVLAVVNGLLGCCDSKQSVPRKKTTYTVKHYHANDPVDIYTADYVQGGGNYVLIFREDGSRIEVHGDYVIIENRE